MICRKKSIVLEMYAKYIFTMWKMPKSFATISSLKSCFDTFSGGSKYENECHVIQKSQRSSFI